MRRLRFIAVVVPVALVFVVAVPSLADHGPSRAGTDPCNGTADFDINNVITTDVVDSVVAQNPGSLNPDGTVDGTKITHALLAGAGHVALQVREKSSAPLDRVTFEFAPTSGSWASNSTNHPSYLTAIEAREDPARDLDGDLVVGKTFTFLIPTDVVPDGNYVARLRGFRPDGSEAGRLCLEATVTNAQGLAEAQSANGNPAYEPTEGSSEGFAPQPILWFPAGEPSAAQQGDYGAQELRVEFVESLAAGSLKLEREENLPEPTGLAGTASPTGGSLETGTYFYKVSAVNGSGETLPSSEVAVPVTGPTGSVTLTWNAVGGATGYRVYRGSTSGAQDVFYSTTATSFTDTNAVGTPGTPNPTSRAKIWVDYTSRLASDDLMRPHFLAGGRIDETPFESALGNEKVWGPGYKVDIGSLPSASLPNERLRISARDASDKAFCGVYGFTQAAAGSYLVDAPIPC